MLTPVLTPFRGRLRKIAANRGEQYDTLALTRADFRAPGEAPEDVLLGRCHRPYLGLASADQSHIAQHGPAGGHVLRCGREWGKERQYLPSLRHVANVGGSGRGPEMLDAAWGPG